MQRLLSFLRQQHALFVDQHGMPELNDGQLDFLRQYSLIKEQSIVFGFRYRDASYPECGRAFFSWTSLLTDFTSPRLRVTSTAVSCAALELAKAFS